MEWPEDVVHEARYATERFFDLDSPNNLMKAMMLSFAYGYTEAHDQIRREKVLADFIASVKALEGLECSLFGQSSNQTAPNDAGRE